MKRELKWKKERERERRKEVGGQLSVTETLGNDKKALRRGSVLFADSGLADFCPENRVPGDCTAKTVVKEEISLSDSRKPHHKCSGFQPPNTNNTFDRSGRRMKSRGFDRRRRLDVGESIRWQKSDKMGRVSKQRWIDV